MRIFIADDNTAFRTQLVSLLSEIKGIDVVGEAGDVQGAIDAIGRVKPDTVILDLHMPGGSGFDVLYTIKSKRPAPCVILLTVGPKSEFKTISYMAGADYYFEKSSELRRMTRLLKNFAADGGATDGGTA